MAALAERDPDAAWFEYEALTGMAAARRLVDLVSTKDAIERKHLRALAKQYGPSAVDEILMEAWLALCEPLSPLLGHWFSAWFMKKPDEGYNLARKALNLPVRIGPIAGTDCPIAWMHCAASSSMAAIRPISMR